MSTQTIWEIIGYCGSALVLVSLLMSSVIKLRVINTIGSLIFAIYAFKINSIPTALMNLALIFINLYFLYKLLAVKKTFTSCEVKADDSVVQNLMSTCGEDMEKYFGTVDLSRADYLLAVFDGNTVAGLTAGKTDGDRLNLILDYSTPQYRDCSVGRHVHEVLFTRFRSLVYSGNNEQHIDYLQKMGYEKTEDGYEKKL